MQAWCRGVPFCKRAFPLLPAAIRCRCCAMGNKARRAAFERYESAVSRAMLARYGITWADAAGDREPLERALEMSESPEAFVRWWGEKYDLAPVAESRGRPEGRP